MIAVNRFSASSWPPAGAAAGKRRCPAGRAQSIEEFLFADHPVAILVKMGKNAGEAFRIDPRDAGEFVRIKDAVVIIIQFIEALRALFDNTHPDGGLSGSFFLIGKRAVTIGIPRIVVRTVRMSGRMGDESFANGGNVGLSFFFGELPVTIRVEWLKDLRKGTGPKRSPVSGPCGRRNGQRQHGE